MARGRRRSGRRPRTQDAYGKKARREGYAARSVYKLREFDERFKVLRRGDRVLDLGAFPGSWTAYAAQKVAPEGTVLGIDLQAVRAALPPNAEMRQGDVTQLDLDELGGPASFDVVLSDMAPSTIGHRFTDVTRSEQLFLTALSIAERLLRPGGRFAGKVFQGGEFPQLRDEVRTRFGQVKTAKPKATRSESYEVFLVGLDFRGGEPTLPPLGEPDSPAGPPEGG